jgi:hypothetical protein
MKVIIVQDEINPERGHFSNVGVSKAVSAFYKGIGQVPVQRAVDVRIRGVVEIPAKDHRVRGTANHTGQVVGLARPLAEGIFKFAENPQGIFPDILILFELQVKP